MAWEARLQFRHCAAGTSTVSGKAGAEETENSAPQESDGCARKQAAFAADAQSEGRRV